MNNTVATWTSQIYIGLREGYSETVHSISEVHEHCQEYVDAVGLCVTVTPTTFVYRDGSEPGAIVGLINYPRFPSDAHVIRHHARTLAQKLKDAFNQNRVTIVSSDLTEMIGNK